MPKIEPYNDRPHCVKCKSGGLLCIDITYFKPRKYFANKNLPDRECLKIYCLNCSYTGYMECADA